MWRPLRIPRGVNDEDWAYRASRFAVRVHEQHCATHLLLQLVQAHAELLVLLHHLPEVDRAPAGAHSFAQALELALSDGELVLCGLGAPPCFLQLRVEVLQHTRTRVTDGSFERFYSEEYHWHRDARIHLCSFSRAHGPGAT